MHNDICQSVLVKDRLTLIVEENCVTCWDFVSVWILLLGVTFSRSYAMENFGEELNGHDTYIRESFFSRALTKKFKQKS
jgi:hypothetical protein